MITGIISLGLWLVGLYIGSIAILSVATFVVAMIYGTYLAIFGGKDSNTSKASRSTHAASPLISGPAGPPPLPRQSAKGIHMPAKELFSRQ